MQAIGKITREAKVTQSRSFKTLQQKKQGKGILSREKGR